MGEKRIENILEKIFFNLLFLILSLSLVTNFMVIFSCIFNIIDIIKYPGNYHSASFSDTILCLSMCVSGIITYFLSFKNITSKI